MQRSISLAREAEKMGWESTMLCVSNHPYRIDTDLRTNARAARAYRYPIVKITNRFLSRLLPGKEILWSYLDPYYDWVPSAISVGKKLYKKWKYDAIFASAPIYSSLRVGAALKKSLGVPAIADLRDSYAFNFSKNFLHPRIQNFWLAYYNKMLSSYDRITAVDRFAAKGISHNYDIIPNGYNESDFQGEIERFENFTIGYIGSFYPQIDHSPLFRALRVLPPEIKDEVSVLFVGPRSEMILPLARKYGFTNIHATGLVTRDRAMESMRKCHMLLNFLGMVTDSVSAKIYEMARSGATSLNISLKGNEPWKFVEKHNLGINVEPTDTETFAQIIKDAFYRKDYKPPLGIDRFSRSAAAKSIIEIIESFI